MSKLLYRLGSQHVVGQMNVGMKKGHTLASSGLMCRLGLHTH